MKLGREAGARPWLELSQWQVTETPFTAAQVNGSVWKETGVTHEPQGQEDSRASERGGGTEQESGSRQPSHSTLLQNDLLWKVLNHPQRVRTGRLPAHEGLTPCSRVPRASRPPRQQG